MTHAPAGWYPDTQRDGRLRWWDGEAWTEHVHEPALPAAEQSTEAGVAVVRAQGGQTLASEVRPHTIQVEHSQRESGSPTTVETAYEAPFFTFTDHRWGKNGKVSMYRDRIEWIKPRTVSSGKIALGVMTAGTSLVATGVRSGRGESDMIPVHLISGVTTKRESMLNTRVTVHAGQNSMDFLVSHAEAAHVRRAVAEMIRGTHTSATADYSRVEHANQGSTVRDVIRSTDYIERDSATRATAGLFADPNARYVPQPGGASAAPSQSVTPAEPAEGADALVQIARLGQLRDAGFITAEEFDVKKAELLRRL